MLYIPVLYAIVPRVTAAAATVSNVAVPGPGVTGTGEKEAAAAGVTGANKSTAGVTGSGTTGGRTGGCTRSGARTPGGGGTTKMPLGPTTAPGVGCRGNLGSIRRGGGIKAACAAALFAFVVWAIRA